jgi:YjbE family integral membrane protein
VLGAIVLRIVLTLFAMSLLVYPYLKLVGGALLVWIGIKLIAEEDGGDHEIKASDRLLTAVWTIIVADLVMSLDNVMAVAAATKGYIVLMSFGLIVSIPIVVIGAQVIMRLMGRYPVLVVLGGGLLSSDTSRPRWRSKIPSCSRGSPPTWPGSAESFLSWALPPWLAQDYGSSGGTLGRPVADSIGAAGCAQASLAFTAAPAYTRRG